MNDKKSAISLILLAIGSVMLGQGMSVKIGFAAQAGWALAIIFVVLAAVSFIKNRG